MCMRQRGTIKTDWRRMNANQAERRAHTAGLDPNCYEIFNALDQGFCTIEMLFDAAGVPKDYRFLQVNDAFEQQTGLRDATGRRMRELAPAHEEQWFRIYDAVARTGTPERFEQEAAALNRWFDVYAFRGDEPQLHREPAELWQVVLSAIELAGPRLEQHFVDVQVPREGLGVNVDRGRMAQVFANLLSNAAKYSDVGSRILVTGSRRSDIVRITV